LFSPILEENGAACYDNEVLKRCKIKSYGSLLLIKINYRKLKPKELNKRKLEL
jgi:hypothetical protein